MKVLTLFKLFQPYEKFCLPELKALLSPYNLSLQDVFKYDNLNQEHFANPYLIKNESFTTFPNVYINVPEQKILTDICQRSVTVECFLCIIGQGKTYDEALKNVDLEKYKHILHNKEQKICFTVIGQNATFSKKENITKINAFMDGLQMQGMVDLNQYTQEYMIVEHHEECYNRVPDEDKSRTLKQVYFGLVMARARGRRSKQSYYYKYDLTTRAYLAPTSTDNTLAFLMANQAVVQPGEFIFDPFVGSASLLIPPSHFQALCWGQDLDSRILHGTGVGRFNNQSQYYHSNKKELENYKPKILINFQQYGLNRPEIIRQDTVLANMRFVEFFDAIICDPPYGMRALTRKTGKREDKQLNPSRQEEQLQLEDQRLVHDRIKYTSENNIFDQKQYQNYKFKSQLQPVNSQSNKVQLSKDLQDEEEKIPINQKQIKIKDKQSKQNDDEDDEGSDNEQNQEETKQNQVNGPFIQQTKPVEYDLLVEGLIQLACRILKKDGRLVFLYPVNRNTYKDQPQDFPKHERFQLLDYSESPISAKKSRVLLTMKKLY